MKLKKVAPALLAIVLGCIAAKLARDSISRSRPAPVAPPKVVQIVVASSNLTIGQEVRPESLAMSTITATMPPPETFTNLADVTGRVLTSPVLKGQTILNSYLAPRGSAAGLAPLVPAGMRAMTINVDEGNSLSGMLLPGCRVDVVGTIAAGKESVTRTLMRNVLIQAVGQRLTSAKPEDGKEPPPFHTVTLILTPHEAQVIELTQASARMRLLLRGLVHGTEEEVDPGNVSMDDIRGYAEKPVAPIAVADTHAIPTTMPAAEMVMAPARRTVELIKGGGATPLKVQFELPRQTEAGGEQDLLKPAISGQDERPEN